MSTKNIFKDDRTDNQKASHNWLTIGTDSFMSGWGEAKGVPSYAAWACKAEDIDKVEEWVKNRGEMKRVRVVQGNYRPKSPCHCHVYVVGDNHPSLR